MDTVTHALAGYMIARTDLTRDTGRWGIIAGVLSSVFPDVDNVLGIFFGTEFYVKYHRSIANSFFLVIPLSLLFAWLFAKVSKVKKFWSFFLIWVVELLAHTFLDLVTSYGTMILSPLSHHRFALDWVFIIDPFLTSAFLLPLMALCIWRRRGKTLARISVAMAAFYIFLCACNHFWALSLAKAYVQKKGMVTQEVASLPQPLSPFHWGNYIVTEKKIYEGFVNLIGTSERVKTSDGNLFSRILARYQPICRLQYQPWDRFDGSLWAERALTLEEVQTFLWFARFPVARYKGIVDGYHRVTFFDLRFGSINDRRPFLYVVEFDQEGEVAFQGFR